MAEINVVGTTNLEVTPESEQMLVGNFSNDPQVGEDTSLNGDYDNLSIPDELFTGEQSAQESDTEQAVTTESTEPAETEATNEEPQELSEGNEEQTEAVSDSPDDNESSFVFESEDGSRYTLSDIESWKQDADNRHDWSKSNTEKAQQLADQRRAVEPLVQLVEKIKESEDFSDTLIEAIEDELGKDAGQLFRQTLQMDNKDLPNPWEAELQQAQEQVAQMEAEKVLDQSMAELKSTYSLNDKQTQEVLDYAIQKHEQDGRLLTLDEAYKVMNFDKPKGEPESKPKPSVPVNVQKSVGVKSDKQEKITNYDDIDVASFFNT
tara:strand:- start:9255 stop:10217 length:963 start_codon:yes stop_codon:yes gene_type:complete